MSGYEKRDINVTKTVILSFFVVAVIAVSIVLLNEYFLMVTEEISKELVLGHESVEYKQLRQAEDSLLSTYGMVDSAKAVYRIPIDTAMNLIAKEAAAK